LKNKNAHIKDRVIIPFSVIFVFMSV